MKDSKYLLYFKVKISLAKKDFRDLQHIKKNLNNTKENQNHSKNVILREKQYQSCLNDM